MISLLALFSIGVQASFILVPKEHQRFTFDFVSFNAEHSVEHLATVDDFTLYKTDTVNYNKYKNTFDHIFDVEEEQVYTVNPINESDNNNNDNILFVQEPGSFDFNIQQSVPWHLDRIDKRYLPLDGSYAYNTQGSCHKNSKVNIETYIVDTGCDVDHPEYEGRAEFLENFTGDGKNTDGNSHGSHCAGIVGSKTYGVCKDANIKCVKVLDSQGSGTTSGVIKGLNYVFNRHLQNEKKNPNVRSIMSMSLGGGFSVAMNRLVEKMIKSSNTFYIVAAAGNENQDACKTSPASADGVLTVMAMGKDDQRASFSNYGKCCNIYGTGVNIKSTIPGGKTAVYSGSSMSAPETVGVLNHILDENPQMNQNQILTKMLRESTKNIIKSNPKDTPNLMSYIERKN